MIVGAFKNSSETGRVYLYDYFMKNEITADMTITGNVPDARLGMSVSTAGDVNGDGYSDVIVGQDAYSAYTGRAFIYFGGPVMDNNADVTMTGNSIYDSFGCSVSTAGDVNGDGYSDVIVGAYGEIYL
ncbi:MAG: FG-GAP repeat protein [Ignavibacteria bacterium]|nr:FG-GAP repeat protein [Ignavibacteria bacterium]